MPVPLTSSFGSLLPPRSLECRPVRFSFPFEDRRGKTDRFPFFFSFLAFFSTCRFLYGVLGLPNILLCGICGVTRAFLIVLPFCVPRTQSAFMFTSPAHRSPPWASCQVLVLCHLSEKPESNDSLCLKGSPALPVLSIKTLANYTFLFLLWLPLDAIKRMVYLDGKSLSETFMWEIFSEQICPTWVVRKPRHLDPHVNFFYGTIILTFVHLVTTGFGCYCWLVAHLL